MATDLTGSDVVMDYTSGGGSAAIRVTQIQDAAGNTVLDTTNGSVQLDEGITLNGTLTVGADDTGHDVTLYGATAGQKVFWDESLDTLNLDCTTQCDGTLTVGVDDTGYDVTFFGATAGQKVFWDESLDTLNLDCTTQCDGTVTVGVDDTGYDVQFFGATAGAHMLWDESADTLKLVGTALLDVADTTASTSGTTGAVTVAGGIGAAKAVWSDVGFAATTETLTANTDEGAASSITAGATNVAVTAVNADANDFIVLPAIAGVPIGHTINISCNAGSNFEMRTPSTSNTTINDVDADGTAEYLCTDTDLIRVTKHTATGWIAQSITKLGAVRTAVVPD